MAYRLFPALLLAALPAQGLACALELPEPEPEPEPAQYSEPSYSVGRMADLVWTVVEIGGRPIAREAGLSLEITPVGNVAGHTGCNRFSGAADLDAGTMILGPLAATEMACVPDVMELERRYLDALGTVAGFAVDSDGTLRLMRADGSVAVSLR
jgi:heat shock protein HslJ